MLLVKKIKLNIFRVDDNVKKTFDSGKLLMYQILYCELWLNLQLLFNWKLYIFSVSYAETS